MYDHNNGLRIAEAERVSGKLLIIGLLILPTRSPRAILTTKALVSAAGALEVARYPKKQLRVVKGILKSPRRRRNVTSRPSRLTASNPKPSKSDKKTPLQILKRKQSERGVGSINDLNPDGLPKAIPLSTDRPRLGIISMFDGVGSVYHIIKKKLGRAPTVYIAAETDPVLRRLVAAELGLREDRQWGYTVEGVTTIYVKDVWRLLDNDSLILRQAKAMYPDIKWLLIAGSPCQDLTFAGYLNGLLGLTGQRSMLFFVVYIVLCHLQSLFGYDAVRFLTENAGSMQVVQRNPKHKTGYQLDQSEHFQMFIHCLGLPTNIPTNQWIWDASTFYGVRRKRVFFRSHLDTAAPVTSPPPGNEEWGPLIYFDYQLSPLAPLLRTRGYTDGGILKLSWTGYQPYVLMWNYAFFGGKKAFASLSQLSVGSKFPTLPWASIAPAHFLNIWKEFLTHLQAEKSKTTRRDELVDQLIPIFHNPNIMLPMRILTVQEVRTLSGLENILTTERHGATILTVHWSLVTLFTVSMFWSLLAILIQTFKDFRGETRCCKLMLKELVLMERSWHRETPVVLKVCVCWQESFLCVQGQKRLSSTLSFWQRRTRRLQVLPRWVTSYVRSTLDCQGFARWLKLCLQLCPELDLKCKQVTWPSCFCVRCHMMFVRTALCMQQVMLILTFALLRCVLRRSNACLLSWVAHLHQVHEVCMHWKVLRPLKSGGDTIRKVTTILSMPRKKILMINGNGTKMCRFGSVLLLRQEREVPTPLWSVTCADVVGTWPSSARPIWARWSVFIAPSLVTLVRNAPTSPKVQQGNSKRSPSRKLGRAKVKERCMS